MIENTFERILSSSRFQRAVLVILDGVWVVADADGEFQAALTFLKLVCFDGHKYI